MQPQDPNLTRRESYLAQPGCRVYNDAAISIANNSWAVLLTFNTEHYDEFDMHSTTVNTGRITIQVSGRYDVGAHVRFEANAVGVRYCWLLMNGALSIAYDSTTAGAVIEMLNPNVHWSFVAGDYFEVGVYQNSGGPLDVEAPAIYTPSAWAQRVG